MATSASTNVGTPRRSASIEEADPTTSERAIRKTCVRIGAAWTAGDSRLLAAAWLPDGDHISLTRVSRIRRGQHVLQRTWMEAFARRPSTYSRMLRVKVDTVRVLTSDTAIVDGLFEYGAGTGVDGRHEPTTLEPFTAVMVRRDDEWRIAASRVGPNMLARKFVRLPSEEPVATASRPHLDSTGHGAP